MKRLLVVAAATSGILSCVASALHRVNFHNAEAERLSYCGCYAVSGGTLTQWDAWRP